MVSGMWDEDELDVLRREYDAQVRAYQQMFSPGVSVMLLHQQTAEPTKQELDQVRELKPGAPICIPVSGKSE
jgi:calcineurin-like phosphoesterase family protein